MENFYPLRQKPVAHNFKKGDLLVLFGELFNRGYANGLVEEAEKCGLTIVRATVGRRVSSDGSLRALTVEESEHMPKPFINVPLEAGFDFEKDEFDKSPVDYLTGIKLSDWASGHVPENSLNFCQNKGRTRFRLSTQNFLAELSQYTKPSQHIHFAHLMAGGVPRCKIVMPLMNRVFKGLGDRYLESEVFWKSGIGKLLEKNFHEVTAETFNILIEESTAFRNQTIANGGSVSYVAYGYHGTEIIINKDYHWQSYAPYIQGWAKVALENYSKSWAQKGVNTCVYNCPEILTNSSSIFQGVEIPLYNLMRAFDKDAPNHAITQKLKTDCSNVLKDEFTFETVFKIVDDFLASPVFQKVSVYKNWPQHSHKDQLELGLNTSDQIIALHKNEKELMTAVLSELVFKACGYVMLHDAFKPQAPVAWIGHDLVVKSLI